MIGAGILLGIAVAQGVAIGEGLVRAVGVAARAVVIVHGGLGAGGTALQVGIIHQLLGEVVAQGITIGIGVCGAALIAAGAVVVVHGGLGAGGTGLQVGIIHQLLGEVVAQGITIGIGIRGAAGIAAGAVVVVHGRLGAGSGTLQVGGICHFLGEVVAQGITIGIGIRGAVGIAAGAVVVVHGGLAAGGTTLQVGIIHQLLGEVVVQGGLQEAIVGVVSLRGIHVAVLVGKILAAVGAVPVGIVAGLGAVGVLSLGLSDVHMVIGVLIRQLVAADLALGLGYAGGFMAGMGLVGCLLGAAVVLADLPVVGGIALIGLALVVVAQSGQQEGRVGSGSGGRIQLAVLIGIVVAAVGAVPIGQVAAHLAGGSHSGRLGGASMGQRSDGKVRGIGIEVLVAVLEILVAVGTIAICLVTLAAAGGSGGSGGSNLGCRMIVGIHFAVPALTDGTHSLGGAGGGGVGGVIFPLLGGAAGHGAAAPVLGVVMLPTAPNMIGGVGDGEGPGGCREAIGGSEVTVAGDDQVHLIGAGIGGILYHIVALLIHQGGHAAAQGQRRVQGDGGGLGMAVPNQVFGGSKGEVLRPGRTLGDGPGDGVVGDSAAPLVLIRIQLHRGGVGTGVGSLGIAADGVTLAGDQEGVLVAVIGISQGGCGEADRLEILRYGHSGGIGGVGNIRCLDADIVGALAAYGGSSLGAGGPGLAVGRGGPLHSGLGAADLAVHGPPGAGSHALKAAGSGGLRLGGGGGEGQGHILRRGGAGDGDLGEAVTGDGDAVLGQIGRVVLGEVIAVFGGDGHIRNGMVLQNRLLQVAGGDGHIVAPGDGDGAGLGDDVKLILVGIQLHLIALIAGEIVLAGRIAGDIDGCDGAAVLQGLYLGGDTDGGACGEAGDSREHCSSSHFREIEVVDHSLGVVAGNIHLAGQLKDPAVAVAAFGNDTGIHTAAAPFFERGGRIAGDGGVADLHGAGGVDAAAAFGGVILNGGILDDRRDIGVLFGPAALGSGNIHAAAQAIPAVIAGNGGTVNGEGAIVCVDAAAAMRSGVAGDVGFANGEGAAVRVDTAALNRGAAGDGAAVDGDGGAIVVHSAAVAGPPTGTIIFFGFSGFTGDGAAVHGEDAMLDIHGAAAAFEGLAAEGTGVHDEGAAIHIHHAAVAVCGAGTDGAAVHDELAALHPHAAAILNIIAGATAHIIEAGELAVPQGEGGAGGHIHAPGVPAAAGDRAGLALVAVSDGDLIAVIHINDRVVPGTAADAQAIEAEVDVLGGGPGFGISPQQVIVALGQVFQLGNADPVELFVGVCAVGGVFPGAADAVGVALTVVPQLQAGIPRGQQRAGLVGGRPQDKAVFVVHDEAPGVGGARNHQGGNIPGAEADFAGAGIEAAVRGDGAAGACVAYYHNIAVNNGRHVLIVGIIGNPGLVVLHHDLAGENGGVGAVHSDAAAVPLGFVILNGGILDGGRALAVEVDAAAVAVGEVFGDGAVFNEGSARAAAVDGAAPAGFVIYILGVIGIAREGAVLHREAARGCALVREPEGGGAHGVILKGAVCYRDLAAGGGHQEAALVIRVFAAADVDGGTCSRDKGAAGFLLHGHIGQVESTAGGILDVVGAAGVVGIAGDVAGGCGAMLAVGDVQSAAVFEVDRLALVAVEADIYGVIRAHGHSAGHLGILQQVIAAGGIAGDLGQRIDGGVGNAIVGVSRYPGQHIVAVAVTDQGDLFRLEDEAAVAVTNILAGVGDNRGTLCLLNARQGQGEGDVAAVRRSRRSYKLLRAGEIEVVPGGFFGGVIPNGDGAGAQVHGTLGVQIEAAALIHSSVVLDGAAAQVQGAAYEHAAAVEVFRIALILARHGVGLEGGFFTHGEGAALTDIDACALGNTVAIAVADEVPLHTGVSTHGEGAAGAHKDAAALVLVVPIVHLGFVAADIGIAGHFEGAFDHGHAAAVAGGSVAENFAAGHGEFAAVHINGTAVTQDIAPTGPVVLDNAAGHFEFTAVYIHGAAVKGAAGPFIVGRTVAGELAVIEVKYAGGAYQHAADIVAIGADPAGALVILDGAAIHIKCTVGLHSACLEPGLIGVESIVADAAVIEVEGGSGADDNAAALVDTVPGVNVAGDLAVGAAVGEVKGDIGVFQFDGCRFPRCMDGVAVEAQGPAVGLPGFGEGHIIQQVVAAAIFDQVQAADALAGDLSMAGAGLLAVGTAADAVGVVILAHQLKSAIGGLELGVGAVGGEIAGFAVVGIAGDQSGGDVRARNADLAARFQAGAADGLTGGQVHIVGAALAGVAGDVGDTADGEGGAGKVHAAAQLLGGVAGDGGAAEVQDNIAGVFAGLAIDGAAVTGGGVSGDSAVCDVHGHAAIGVDSAARSAAVGVSDRAAGDGGALHGEGGGILVPGPLRLTVDINSTTLGGVSAVFNSAALLHDHTAPYQADGTAAVDGRTVLGGGTLAQGQLGIRAGHAEKSVFCLSGLFVAVQNNVPEGQIGAVVQFKSVIRIVRCGRK